MKFSGPWKLMPVAILALGLLSACGNKKFNTEDYSSSASAGQYVTTKPKIDIVIFQDNSDSVMNGPINRLKPQMQTFVNNLSSSWDFHFVVLPLLSSRSISNKYVMASDCSTVTGAYRCLTPSQASTFNSLTNDYGWITSVNSAVGSSDKGFQYIDANMTQSGMASSGFLRPDAALAMIILSNGEDTTGVTFITRSDGAPGGVDYNSSATINSFNTYKSKFAAYKVAGLSQFYSVVSPNGGTCQGSNSFAGLRYINMSSALGSRAYDLCRNELIVAFNDIASQLVAVTEAVIFNYYVLDSEPGAILSVTKNGVSIPQSTSNGWSYEGYKQDQPTSYYPTPGNPRTGYFIKLNGSAAYQGADKISVNYQKK